VRSGVRALSLAFMRASNDAADPSAIDRIDFFLRLADVPRSITLLRTMKFTRRSKERAQWTCWLALLGTMAFLPAVESGNQRSAGTTTEKRTGAAITIFDQYGRQARSGRRVAGSQVFDVAVGPVGNKLRFVPDTLSISVGDTVRWTWGSDSHSVTSGTSCTADGQFCSPDNMNCDAGVLSNTGFVYEHTFTLAGNYSYFCALHCFAGMTGVVNVTPPSRPHPTPRPRPTPHPRPIPPG
jgi:plastocyanin